MDSDACTPVPDKETVCGPFVAFPVITRDAERDPVTDGVKTTVARQLPPAGTEPEQLSVSPKSEALAPVKLKEAVWAEFPVLERDTVCPTEDVPRPWLPKVKLDGLAPPMAPSPVPDKDAVCGDPDALSVIDSVPLRVPIAVGVNVTLIVQDEPAATVVQLFVWE